MEFLLQHKRGSQQFNIYFRISLLPEEGGSSVELVPGGRDIQVTESNLYDYVRMYANYRLIKTQEKALEVRKRVHRNPSNERT